MSTQRSAEMRRCDSASLRVITIYAGNLNNEGLDLVQ